MDVEAGRTTAHRRVEVPAGLGATMSTSPVHRTSPAHVHAPPGPASHRFGYVVGACVDALLLYLININPGWAAVPFLTSGTIQVLGLVNASIAVSLVANLVYVVRDPRWLRSLGELATTSIGVLALVRFWRVWPVDLPDHSAWGVTARIAVAAGIVGGLIGILASTVRFVGAVASPPDDSVTR